MTASDPQSAAAPTPTGAIDYRGAGAVRSTEGSGAFFPMVALAATIAAMPAGLGVTIILPKFGVLSRAILPWPERMGFSHADWAGFLTVVGLGFIGALLGHWCRRRSNAHSLRGRAMATLASYGGFLILIGCLIVMLNAATRV